ncbi:MAG: hypothetical protein HY401_08890 [Elusimicrobia bacterium]|nr:hypothetical protein [Elusimicrobiota bacterium]
MNRIEYATTLEAGYTLAFRVGFKTLGLSDISGGIAGLTTGVGLQMGKFTLDLGFAPMGDLGSVFRMGVGVGF